MGKVVDAETGEPLEGGAVLIAFYTETGSLGGTVSLYVDSVETLTDSRGEFRFAPKRANKFQILSTWSDDYLISIFKPGYAAYSGNPKAYNSWEKSHSLFIPEKEYVTYYLPKLLNLEERKKNLRHIDYPSGITNDKILNLRRLESQERVIVGFKPFKEWSWS
jgi:hypothetical protein